MVKPIKTPSNRIMCEAGHCDTPAVFDLGTWERRIGFTGQVRFLCGKHGRSYMPEVLATVRWRRSVRKAGACPTCGAPVEGCTRACTVDPTH